MAIAAGHGGPCGRQVSRVSGVLRQQDGRLCWLGFLLTGDRAKSEDLAQEALVRTFRMWPRVRRYDRPEDYARKVLVNRHRRCCDGRCWRRVTPGAPERRKATWLITARTVWCSGLPSGACPARRASPGQDGNGGSHDQPEALTAVAGRPGHPARGARHRRVRRIPRSAPRRPAHTW